MINHNSLCTIHPGVQMTFGRGPWKFGSDLIMESIAWLNEIRAHGEEVVTAKRLQADLTPGHYQGDIRVSPATREVAQSVVRTAIDAAHAHRPDHWLANVTSDQISAVFTCQHGETLPAMTTQQLLDKLLSRG